MVRVARLGAALAASVALASGAQAATFGDECDAAVAEGPAFTATYGGASPKLVFVAAHHSTDPNSGTFAAVRAAAAARDYGLLVVEGLPIAAGPDEPQYLPADQPDFEGRFAARLMLAAGAPYLGGEPDEPRIIRRLLAEGWPPGDALGALTLRYLSSRVRQAGYPEARLGQDIEAAVASYRKQFPELAAAPFDFAAWYRAAYGEPVGLTSGFIDRGSSCTTGAAARFLGALSQARNEHLLKILLRAKTANRPWLVVYGGGHFAALAPELEPAFGAPVIQSFGR